MIPIRHHVFTTFGGYGSLKTSEDLEPEVREALDERLAPIAAAASAEPLRSCFPVGRHVALVSSFVLGVDHAGRPRSIAHTVLVEREVARVIPWFAPLRASASLFVGPEAASRGFGDALKDEAPLEALAPPIDPREVAAAAAHPAATAVLAALAGRRARAAVFGDPWASARLVCALLPLVPETRRMDVAVLAAGGAAARVQPGASDGDGAAALLLVCRRKTEVEQDDGFALVDGATGVFEGRLVRGAASFALNAYLRESDPHALAALEACYARWSEEGAPIEPPRAFVRAFAELRPFVRNDGSIALKDEAFPLVASAIPAAAEGAARGLAAALVEDGLDRAEKAGDPERLRALLRTVRESAAAAPLPDEPRRFLAALVASVMQKLSSGKAMKRWSHATPESTRALAHEAEALLALLVEAENAEPPAVA